MVNLKKSRHVLYGHTPSLVRYLRLASHVHVSAGRKVVLVHVRHHFQKRVSACG